MKINAQSDLPWKKKATLTFVVGAFRTSVEAVLILWRGPWLNDVHHSHVSRHLL